jgi:hypothetical protein
VAGGVKRAVVRFLVKAREIGAQQRGVRSQPEWITRV